MQANVIIFDKFKRQFQIVMNDNRNAMVNAFENDNDDHKLRWLVFCGSINEPNNMINIRSGTSGCVEGYFTYRSCNYSVKEIEVMRSIFNHIAQYFSYTRLENGFKRGEYAIVFDIKYLKRELLQ